MARSPRNRKRMRAVPVFVDVFAGCGGISLGLLNAGWLGRFAIEKNQDAFNTLKTNLVGGKLHSFAWPKWLPKRPYATATVIRRYRQQLLRLRGKVDLLAGGPPCQG